MYDVIDIGMLHAVHEESVTFFCLRVIMAQILALSQGGGGGRRVPGYDFFCIIQAVLRYV